MEPIWGQRASMAPLIVVSWAVQTQNKAEKKKSCKLPSVRGFRHPPGRFKPCCWDYWSQGQHSHCRGEHFLHQTHPFYQIALPNPLIHP